MLNRAYSLLEVKDIAEGKDEYVITGIASTPSADRTKDIVEPMGAKFKLPMPLLWQHQHDKPVGQVEFAKPNKNGIPYKAVMPVIKEPGALKDRIDEAVQSIKYRLVAAVSIGFKALEYSYKDDGGIHFKEWEWLELSLVTIPANAEATISSIKSFDARAMAASGLNRKSSVSLITASAGASKPRVLAAPVKLIVPEYRK